MKMKFKEVVMVNGVQAEVVRQYRLKEEVASKIKTAVVGMLAVSVLALGFVSFLVSQDITEEEVIYESVYISYTQGEYRTVSEAIGSMNKEVDYRELVSLFESKNDVSSSTIQEGYYLVPIYTSK